ncbi:MULTISPECIES: P-loop NTPase fold protein [unclassified Nostoc]|uniref:P-loop NTPase fold protein n=1 Tax=unclassified Nostoc TaxID=2593658 RepID=UPI002AD38F72|nr:P-loop NTPase fold protein [Nostoc sp. DedQUE03]MDZ7977251.1 P-loop NTPase fold protein [Nostoc sp. DedQUE03]MDZ8047628.1 P-loop NTPase fold protein [Nostoc sp. DedQUE02]
MKQHNAQLNSHIIEYLDYYCNLPDAPGFAVLLKGKWGSGKTWFIKRYCESLREKKRKCLYVSLNGVTSFSEIENAFFQQLFPALSSKPIALAGNILAQIIKGTLKVDFNHDGRDDGTISVASPNVNLTEYFTNLEQSVVIFDDLERCSMNIVNILGYINSFVEQKELKVIIVTDETKLEKNSEYTTIKEKLVGKTFAIYLEFDQALENFLKGVSNRDASEFLSNSTSLIQNLYNQAQCENLRILKQVVLDFERIFDVLPERAKNKPELLQEVLKFLTPFSIEIRHGKMLPTDISSLLEASANMSVKSIRESRDGFANSNEGQNDTEGKTLQEVISKYSSLRLYDPFPSAVWWQTFFDKGSLDLQELNQSLASSIYFQDENTPKWIKLWHFYHLSDDEFVILLNEVETQYLNRDAEFYDPGILKHVTGLLFYFSDIGLYSKTKEEILASSKLYIDWLKNNNPSKLVSYSVSTADSIFGGYMGLGFQGAKLQEFQDFCTYLEKAQDSARVEILPNLGRELLAIMQSDQWKFRDIISLNNSHDWGLPGLRFAEIPILKSINTTEFLEGLLQLKFEDRQTIGYAIKERYKFDDNNEKLLEELDWLKSVRNLLLDEVARRKGKPSGHSIQVLIEFDLNEAIQKLEATTHRLQQSRNNTAIDN